jgi:hypothetical protein
MKARGVMTALTTGLLALALAGPAVARTPSGPGAVSPTTPTLPATGTFAFTTANGILPTWASEDIVLIGVSPGSVTTAASNLTSRITMPIVARTGSANAAAGGFRISNVKTGASLRCSSPTIDTRARLVDCVLPDETNSALFAITSIGSRTKVTGGSTITYVYRKVTLKLNGQRSADLLNKTLSTMTFSPYVTVGVGDLVVTIDR